MPKYFSVIKGSKSDLNEGVILTNNNLQLSFKQNNRIKYKFFYQYRNVYEWNVWIAEKGQLLSKVKWGF